MNQPLSMVARSVRHRPPAAVALSLALAPLALAPLVPLALVPLIPGPAAHARVQDPPIPSESALRELQQLVFACGRENSSGPCEQARSQADPLALNRIFDVHPVFLVLVSILGRQQKALAPTTSESDGQANKRSAELNLGVTVLDVPLDDKMAPADLGGYTFGEPVTDRRLGLPR